MLLGGVFILVSLTVAPASAQVASTVSDVATPPNAASDDGSIGDIVVTAQRREQRLQDVPITISAITSAQAAAAGVTGTSSLQFAVPGLIINRQANNARSEEHTSELQSLMRITYAVCCLKNNKITTTQ